MAPAHFRLPRHIEGGWRLGEFDYDENPLYTVPQWARAMVEAWARIRALRGGGAMGAGAAILPRAGGYGEQPALMMDAFMMFDRWMAERSERNAGADRG